MNSQSKVSSAFSFRKDIRAYIVENFMPGEDERGLRDDDLLFESGLIDSAGAMTFIAFLESRFKIEVLDEDLFPENFASVERILDFVGRKLGR
jgi:acyl carrier protein